MLTEERKNRILDVALALLAGKERRGHALPTVTAREVYERVEAALSDVVDTLNANFQHFVTEEQIDGCKLKVGRFHMGDKPWSGYVESQVLPIKRGDTVTIPKGTTIHTTGARKTFTAGRTYKVKVHYVCCGSVSYVLHGQIIPAQNPRVTWVGAGGYWCEVDINEVPEAQNGGTRAHT